MDEYSYYRGKKLIGRIIEFVKSRTSVEEKVFWHVVPFCSLAALLLVCLSVFEETGFWAVGSVAVCLAAFLILMTFCYRKGDTNRCYLIFCLLLNCVMMPVIFLTNGGLLSSMPLFCMGTLSLCAFCTEKKNRYLAFGISLLAEMAVLCLSVLFPQLVISVRESFIRTDILIGFFFASAALFLIISLTVHRLAFEKVSEMDNSLVGSLGSLIEFRSVETGDHGKQMREMMEILLTHAGKVIPGVYFSKMDIHMISSASMLHDIGKIAVPERILNKPGKLTDEEFEIIKRHPVDGSCMIESMRDYQNPTYYGYCYEICRHHHERYDGTGYPDRLKGNEIPLVSQLASLADMIEALTTKRAYKEAYSPEKSYEVVLSEKGTHFSPQVIDCFISAWPDICALLDSDNHNQK